MGNFIRQQQAAWNTNYLHMIRIIHLSEQHRTED
jgi:hypothetical protein